MLYSARWKKITVDQSKVLRNRLFRFLGGPPGTRYIYIYIYIYIGNELRSRIYTPLSYIYIYIYVYIYVFTWKTMWMLLSSMTIRFTFLIFNHTQTKAEERSKDTCTTNSTLEELVRSSWFSISLLMIIVFSSFFKVRVMPNLPNLCVSRFPRTVRRGANDGGGGGYKGGISPWCFCIIIFFFFGLLRGQSCTLMIYPYPLCKVYHNLRDIFQDERRTLSGFAAQHQSWRNPYSQWNIYVANNSSKLSKTIKIPFKNSKRLKFSERTSL